MIWRRYGRDYTPKDVKYHSTIESEPPEKIDPILANYFLDAKFTNTWFLTSILSLIHKNAYTIDSASSNLILTKRKAFNPSSLNFYETAVYDYFNEEYKDGSISLNEFKNIFSNKKYFKQRKKYRLLGAKIKRHYDSLFYKDSAYFNGKGYLLFVCFTIIYLFLFFQFGGLFISLFLFLFIILFRTYLQFFFKYSFKVIFGKYTKEGILLHYKFINYKNYLKEHSNMYEKDINSIYLWDYHLVYAASFNLTKKINSNFSLILKENVSVFNAEQFFSIFNDYLLKLEAFLKYQKKRDL